MKKLYKVVQAVWGADKAEGLFFSSEEKANEYYNSHDYCDKPELVKVTEEQAKELIEATGLFLYD